MKIKKRISRWLVYRLTRLGVRLVGLFPPQWNLKLGKLGWLAFWLIPRERKRALQSLNIAFGNELDAHALRKIAIEAYQNLGRNIFEFLEFYYYHRLNPADFISIEGAEYVDEALKRGKGIICASAHLGNWELMAMHTAALGYSTNIVARRINNAKLDDLMLQLRQQTGVGIIMRERRGKINRSVIKVLLNNQLLGILMDQDAKVDGVFVDFFGRPAYTPSGAVALALATGATIIPVFIIRQPGNRHLLKFLPPFNLEITGNKKQDILANTQGLTNIIEDYVRKFPTQWVWMHRRWRKQPKHNGVTA